MHRIAPLQPQNVTPWEVPFATRLNQLYQGFRQKKRNVIYLYEKADTSTFRYRAHNMCQALRSSRCWNGAYFFENELEQLVPSLDWVQLAVLIRFRWDPGLERFLQALSRAGIPAAFDVDDFVFDIGHLPLIASALNVDLDYEAPKDPLVDYWAAYLGRLQLTARACQSFITTNAFIGSRLEKAFGKPARFIPNFLNEAQMAVSRWIWRAKEGQPSVSPFTLGYFSGTPSHANDFRMIAPELKELMEQQSDINLTIVGFMEIPGCLRPLKELGRIAQEPLQNFCELQRRIAQVDVNLIPLADNEFTNCKSELKYFEAAIVGTLSCASPTFVYKKLIRHGENGFLCEPGQWQPTLEKVFRGEFDRAAIPSAMELSLREFGADRQLPVIESVLDQIAGGL